MTTSKRPRWAAVLGAALFLVAPAAHAPDPAGVKRWKRWRADLDHLFTEIDKPSSLNQLFKLKGIKWNKVKKEAMARFSSGAKAAKKRRKDDKLADQVAFYGVLQFVIGQLRDSHAYVRVDNAVSKEWNASRSTNLQAGIEFLTGTHGTIIVANTYAARGANSPLRQRGVMHDATILESIDGTPAAKYFAAKAREKFEEGGWCSTLARAQSEAMNGVTMAKGEAIEFVFKTLDMPEAARRRHLGLPPRKQAKAFAKLRWKKKKVKLRANECANAQNARNFHYLALKRPELTKTSDGGVWYGVLPSGTGYIRYTSVSKTSRAGLDQACTALADCSGLIVDMRFNGGGGYSGVGAFDKREGTWKRPFAVLLGPRCMSQGETELWELQQMRAQKRCEVRLFGLPTAGSSGRKVQFELPSGFAKGQFVIRDWDPQKIEGIGIQPDDVVEQDVVELSLGIDSCIRAAEAWLGSQ